VFSKHFIRISFLMLFLSLAAKAYPSEHKFKCHMAKDLIPRVLQQGFAYVATAEESHGAAVQLFINVRTLSWQLIGIDSDLRACVLLEGPAWHFLKVQSI
jgi:hypothetical protein